MQLATQPESLKSKSKKNHGKRQKQWEQNKHKKLKK